MKKILIKYIPILLVLTMLSSSCSKDFLSVSNPNAVALSSFYSSPQDAIAAVNTAYNGLQFGGMFGLNYFFLFNSFSDRILFETTNYDDFVFGSSLGQISILCTGPCMSGCGGAAILSLTLTVRIYLVWTPPQGITTLPSLKV